MPGCRRPTLTWLKATERAPRWAIPLRRRRCWRPTGRAATEPLWLGSIKSNMGHTQAAAGVAGVIKMVLAMRHEMLPATLHVDEPSPHVDWSTGSVSLLTEARPWPARGRMPTGRGVLVRDQRHQRARDRRGGSRRAGVPRCGSDRAPWCRGCCRRNRRPRWHRGRPAGRHTCGPTENLTPPTWRGRWRAVRPSNIAPSSSAASVSGLLAGLDGLAGDAVVPVIQGAARAGGKTAFVFPGQGSQLLGMGAGLHAAYPVFAEAFNSVVGELDRHLLRPLRDVMWGDDENLLNTTEFAQAALFAVEVALFRLLESWGVRPDFVMGHSIGELSAAHVAGVLSLENAAVLVAARGRFMQALPAGGAMFAVQATEEEVRPLLRENVGIAAVNGPASVVISGSEDAVIADRGPAAR